MLIAQGLFCFAVPLTMLFANVLSVSTGVGGYWWSMSARAIVVAVAFLVVLKYSSLLFFFDDAMTFLIILYSTFTGPFWGGVYCIGVLHFGTSKKYSPALLRASAS